MLPDGFGLNRVLRAAMACLLIVSRAGAEDDIAEALEGINQQIQAKPNDGRLLVQRSRLLALQKKFDQALADLDQANRLTPFAEIDRERAQVYLAAGWYETGLEHASRHLTRQSSDAEGYAVRGRLNARLDRPAEAGKDFAAAIQHTKQPPIELYLERAQALTTPDGAHLQDALGTIEQAIVRVGPVVTLESAALEIELR